MNRMISMAACATLSIALAGAFAIRHVAAATSGAVPVVVADFGYRDTDKAFRKAAGFIAQTLQDVAPKS